MQSKQEIEDSYRNPDPWGYRTNPLDRTRKQFIIGIAKLFVPGNGYFQRAIDIACGEGFITEDLPAGVVHGIELSDTAASRFHPSVTRVERPVGTYDLVVATGCLYGHYDWHGIVQQIEQAKSPGGIILVSNIEAWENSKAIHAISTFTKCEAFEARFPYPTHGEPKNFQKVRVFLS